MSDRAEKPLWQNYPSKNKFCWCVDMQHLPLPFSLLSPLMLSQSINAFQEGASLAGPNFLSGLGASSVRAFNKVVVE